MKIRPARAIFFGFLSLILLGTFLLSLPISTRQNSFSSLITSLFTATSAVCVTGLSIVDIGQYYSLFGQAIILFLIQIGGLGYMTVASLIILIVQGRLTLEQRMLLSFSLDEFDGEKIGSFIKNVAGLVFSIEAAGAVFLSLYWMPRYDFWQAIYLGIFHSVSAFCNAGFTLFSHSLLSFQSDWYINLVFAFLIILGGLGYIVIKNLYHYFFKRKTLPKRLTLHTKMVLVMTAILILAGLCIFLFFEARSPLSLAGLPWHEKILVSFFQVTTSRTAGFSTININSLSYATMFLIIIFMFIGGSPGGTAGGIKTTTFFVLLANAWSGIKGKKEVSLFKKRISPSTINKSFVLFFLGIFLIGIITIIMLKIEQASFASILFEVFSAFGTVGLSTGITSNLSAASKLLLILTMFIGRIGLLTMALSLARREGETLYRYPEEKILVG